MDGGFPTQFWKSRTAGITATPSFVVLAVYEIREGYKHGPGSQRPIHNLYTNGEGFQKHRTPGSKERGSTSVAAGRESSYENWSVRRGVSGGYEGVQYVRGERSCGLLTE